MVGTFIGVVPIYFLLNQNYQIFYALASKEAPSLLQALEREQAWINTILVATLLGLAVFFTLLGVRITNRIVGPLRVLRNHIKQLCRGNFHQNPIKVRTQDEFQDLIEAYNYFYNSFQQNLKRDIEMLQKMQVDPKNRDAYLAWTMMIEEKTLQLQPPTPLKPLISAAPAEFPDSRRAS